MAFTVILLFSVPLDGLPILIGREALNLFIGTGKVIGVRETALFRNLLNRQGGVPKQACSPVNPGLIDIIRDSDFYFSLEPGGKVILVHREPGGKAFQTQRLHIMEINIVQTIPNGA